MHLFRTGIETLLIIPGGAIPTRRLTAALPHKVVVIRWRRHHDNLARVKAHMWKMEPARADRPRLRRGKLLSWRLNASMKPCSAARAPTFASSINSDMPAISPD